MKVKNILLASALCFCMITGNAQTKVIAHRGYWKCENSAQNSLASLKKAAEINTYGSEFDVQMTSDSILVVNHDDDIEGHQIAKTPYNTIKDIKLKNGETLPTLEKYLKEGKNLSKIKLILEIKPSINDSFENELTKRTVDMIKRYKLQKKVEFISFSMNVCEQLVKLTPKSHIAYLGGDVEPKDLRSKGMDGFDYEEGIVLKNPQWIEQAHKLGMKVNVWTVNNEDKMKKLINLKVDYITTNYPVKAKELSENK